MTLKQIISAGAFLVATAIAPASYGIGSIGTSGGMWCEIYCASDTGGSSTPTIILPLPGDFTGDEDAFCMQAAFEMCQDHGATHTVNVVGGGQSAVPPRRRNCETTDNGSGNNQDGDQSCNPERTH